MNIYTSDDFVGMWPVGTAAVIVAEDEAHARRLLDEELVRHKLDQPVTCHYTLKEVPIDTPTVIILRDGNY